MRINIIGCRQTGANGAVARTAEAGGGMQSVDVTKGVRELHLQVSTTDKCALYVRLLVWFA